MKFIAVLIATVLTICYNMSASLADENLKENLKLKQNKNTVDKYVSDNASNENIISLLPLKILLEYKLKTEHELQRALSKDEFQRTEKLQADFIKENSDLVSTTQKNENSSSGFCSEVNLLRNLSEILGNVNNNENYKEKTLTKEQLQKIYDFTKDCFYIKTVNSKLWGPLWHCLNRLFLFFVFN